jgi:hypothetical protein
MNDKQVTETNLGKIIVGSYLGSGQLATVYQGTTEKGVKVAIKFPAFDFDPNGSAFRLLEEYDLLKNLDRKLREFHYDITVPHVEKGKDNNGNIVLVMEYVGNESLLGDVLFKLKDDPLRREMIVLQAALQYSRLLETLHSISYTCQDRKTTDLRWVETDQGSYPDMGRLIVLDWNAVNKDNTDVNKDIILFGDLWYQLVTGKLPPSVINPLDDMLWESREVSYGTRNLLAQMFNPVFAEKPLGASELCQAFADLLRLYTLDVDSLFKEGSSLLNEIKRQNELARGEISNAGAGAVFQTEISYEKEWKALIYLDLAYRRGQIGTKEFEEILLLVENQGFRLVGHIEHAILIDDNQKGDDAVNWAKKVAQYNKQVGFELLVLRWEILLSARKKALEDGLFLRDLWSELGNWLHKVEAGVAGDHEPAYWMDLGDKLDEFCVRLNADNGAGKRTAHILENFKCEISTRVLIANINDKVADGNYRGGLDLLSQVRPDVSVIDKHFLDVFSKTLPSLDLIERDLKEKDKKKNNLVRWQEEIIPSKVFGNLRYIDYLLQLRLREVRSRINDADVYAAEKWLKNLQVLYRCMLGGDLHPLPATVAVLWNEIPPSWKVETQKEVERCLVILSKRAEWFSGIDAQISHEEALHILQALQKTHSITNNK